MKQFKKLVIFGAGVALAAQGVQAQTAAVPNANTIITAAETASTAVMALCVVVGGFFVIYKIVKWIRK